MSIVFIIDESGRFVFPEKEVCDSSSVALVAGLAISLTKYKDFIDYLRLNHLRGDGFEKGSQIAEDKRVENFIDFLRQNVILSAFVPADHRYTSLEEVKKFQIIWCDDLENYLKQEHIEYQTLSQDQKIALLNDLFNVINDLKTIHPQDFYNMLMIFEVIDNLMRKLFVKLNELDYKDLVDITIIIDTQSAKVTSLIKKGFLGCFLFAVSRKSPFKYNGRNFKKSFGEKSYLDAKRFTIKIASDDDEPIIFFADYLANFTRKVLIGQITSKMVVNKLKLLYEDRAQFFYFNPAEEYKYVTIPEKVCYAYEQLVQDVS